MCKVTDDGAIAGYDIGNSEEQRRKIAKKVVPSAESCMREIKAQVDEYTARPKPYDPFDL